MSAPEESFPTAVILFPSQDAGLVTFCRNVCTAFETNPKLANPTPSLAVFKGDVDAFDTAQQKAVNGGKGKAKDRNAARKKVKADVHHLRDFLQGIAEQEPNPAAAAALIQSVLSVKRAAKRQPKPELAAKNTGISGRVLLDAKAVANEATYFFEYSVDSKTWTSVPDAMQCKVTIDGLTPGTKYYFRFRATMRKSRRDYSQIVSLIVQ